MKPTTPSKKRAINSKKTTRLYRHLREKGIEQAQVAALSGLSENRVSRLVCGRAVPREQERHLLARALNVDEGALFDPLAHLEGDEARAARAAAWFATDEGKLFLTRFCSAVLEG